jgi:hypothetical protein
VAFTDAVDHGEPVSRPAVHQSTERKPRRTAATRRKLFADYLADARAAWSAGVVVTPAWIREVTGCSRGLSPRLAAALAAELDTTEPGREQS